MFKQAIAAAALAVTGMAHAFVDQCGVYPQADDSLRAFATFVKKR